VLFGAMYFRCAPAADEPVISGVAWPGDVKRGGRSAGGRELT
jgi:hypothetical protein